MREKRTYRREYKTMLSPATARAILKRLGAIMRADKYHAATSGRYAVHSLYYDSLTDGALAANLSGESRREKFRLRYYDDDFNFIRLEKKFKIGEAGAKDDAPLSESEARRLISGDIGWMLQSDRALLREFYFRARAEGLRPKLAVDYQRTALVYAPGNVRVTMDTDVRVRAPGNFFVPDAGRPILDGRAMLEVKFDHYLPSVVADALREDGMTPAAFSKYAAGRLATMETEYEFQT